jgi:hypothetical protein
MLFIRMVLYQKKAFSPFREKADVICNPFVLGFHDFPAFEQINPIREQFGQEARELQLEHFQPDDLPHLFHGHLGIAEHSPLVAMTAIKLR